MIKCEGRMLDRADKDLSHFRGEGRNPVLRRADITVSAHSIPGGAVLRVASETVESALREIRSHLGFLSALLGDNPLARKW